MCFLCQAEDGIRDLVRSRGLGDVYKRQEGGGDRVGESASGSLDLDPGQVASLSTQHTHECLSLIHI